VVRADDLQALALEHRHTRQQFGADQRMSLHHAAFLGLQGAALLEDGFGDPDLADVVQEEAVFEARVVE